MIVLGIETSCDETSAAVVRNGSDVLSNVVNSQVKLHAPYGGVVPEIASRSHVEALPPVIAEAMRVAEVTWEQVDAVAVTYGPGLASSLLVGLAQAKALSLRLGKPLCGINHLEAHIYSSFLGEPGDDPRETFNSHCPLIAFVVSGGHTCLLRVEELGNYRLLGQTIDDAAGEAFDKGATLMGLEYPGGPAIDRAAADGDPAFVRFPRGLERKRGGELYGLNAELCFSFSGLKTALLYYLKDNPIDGDDAKLASIAASYQEAIVDALIQRCERSLRGVNCFVAGGGVTLNKRLRKGLETMAKKRGAKLMLAEPRYCGDNAAMIAGLAGAGAGVWGDAAMALDADPNLGW